MSNQSRQSLRGSWRSWLADRLSRRGGPSVERERDRSEQATLLRARRRQAGIFLAVVVLLGLLFGRTAYWQLSQHDALAARANAETLRALPIPAGRGAIYDANGRLLAVSVTQDTVIADPDVLRSAGALNATAATLAHLLGLSAGAVRGQLDVPGAYVRLRDAAGQTLLLSQAQSDAVSAAIAGGSLPGVALIPQVRRVYPEGSLAAQVLGFVSQNDGRGAYGVEQQYEQALAGQPGVLYTAVDAQQRPLATGVQHQTPAAPGSDLTLTLDATVQYWAEQGLAQAVSETRADGGTVVVLDPHTGAIVALASLPSFDPNAYWQAPLQSFLDPAVNATYDPGSVMKAVTMAAGIDSGAITPASAFFDTGAAVVDSVALHNWDLRAHGEITMTQVLQYSANTGAVWVERQLGAARLERYVDAFGFLHTTGVDLPAEAAGSRDTTSAPNLTAAENAFGESIAVTPLQLAAAYGALANGGLLMRPYIDFSAAADGGVGPVTTYGPQPLRQVVSAATAQKVTQMLVDSARVSEAEMNLLPGYAIAAKTGTSTPDPSDPAVTYASVVGYAPAANPRFVLLVKLDHPRTTIFGGSAAGPLWRALAQQLFVYEQIPPDA
jgi:cell division protein FtsI/penicillin-binding protein 2